MERRKFEDSFKEAFDGAEVDPSDNVWAGIEQELEKTEGSFKQAFYGAETNLSDNVWTGIELELEKAEGDRTRRRLTFYKLLAAASITFALCVAGLGYYIIDRRTAAFNEQLAAATTNQPSGDVTVDASDPMKTTDKQRSVQKETQSENSARERRQTTQSNQSASPLIAARDDNSSRSNSGTQTTSATIDMAQVHNDSEPSSAQVNDKYADRTLPAFYSAETPRLAIPKNEVDPGVLLLAELAAEEQKYAQLDKKEKEQKAEKLWTSVGIAAGAFNSVNTEISPSPPSSGNNTVAALSNSTVPDKQAKASGVSYSVGINVGTKLSKRWTIQGGINYLTQSSDYTATNVVAQDNFQTLKAESINELDKLPELADAYASSKLTPTFPYTVNNNVKYFSVPVQAGYLLVNQKFGLQLNAGLSTDLFLENTITPEVENINVTTQGRGSESPYRSVNFSGLMGTEFSYRFGTRYRISLNPGLRYPLNSVYKNGSSIQSTPLTFDVGLRFKYIFH